MQPLRIQGPIGCRTFRDWLYHLQGGELVAEDGERLRAHARDCPACETYREAEERLLIGLKARLRPGPAPEDLRRRVRQALEQEAHVRYAPRPWYRGPALAALAAAALLVALLVPSLGGLGRRPAGGAVVTVVDGECDRAGRTFAQQAACRDARHVNELKGSDGRYWTINLDSVQARDLAFDPLRRGRPLRVEADYDPRLGAVHLIRVSDLSAVLM